MLEIAQGLTHFSQQSICKFQKRDQIHWVGNKQYK